MRGVVVLKQNNGSNVEPLNRRKHWLDRRSNDDRRNPARQHLENYDCREDNPRRRSDICGELGDGEIWWNDSTHRYE